ncbi:putative G-protein coupled receptor-like protein, partial [Leptotrombidium deliense]
MSQAKSHCIFTPGSGWRKGGYQCECKKGYYSAASNTGGIVIPVFNGTKVEAAWSDKVAGNELTYNVMFTCKKCAVGCEVCTDGSPCLSSYDWAFRISLLTISILCIILTVLLFSKLRVPYFYVSLCWAARLCIPRYASSSAVKDMTVYVSQSFAAIHCPPKCVSQYSQIRCRHAFAKLTVILLRKAMVAIFPVLDSFFCIVTKVTRHMGFCITYSALLLKTWRVSLTYRVKSAHKLKLTDKQLLQWLFPILLVMAIYLGTWTISAPPQAIYIEDWNGLKFKICNYNWWDHSIAIGEFLFLLWGIKVCYSVRNAESFFNEAKYITWAIYNIAIVNILMIFIHLLILPNAGADVKYFFGFLRTQLSTTTTMMLIFGPKFYR